MLNFFAYEFSSLYFMKILLLGDYSNVHATLASALRTLGHEVTLASDGDSWKNYPRDVDLKRPSLGKFSSIAYYCVCFSRLGNSRTMMLFNSSTHVFCL